MSRSSETPRTCATCAHWTPNDGWGDLYRPSNYYDLEEDDPARWAQVEQHNRESGICQKVVKGWTDDDGESSLPLATCWDGSELQGHTSHAPGLRMRPPRGAPLLSRPSDKLNRVQLTVMLDLGTMTDSQVEALRRDIDHGGYDWAALHGVSLDGEEPEPMCSGGFNPKETQGLVRPATPQAG